MQEKILYEVGKEVERAMKLYPTFNSLHEGYAVILEELDELWDAIKASKSLDADEAMCRECVQVAAMAVRFIQDLGGRP